MLERADIREEIALLAAACPGQIPPETARVWAEEIFLRAQDLEREDLATGRSRLITEEGRPTLARWLGFARERGERRKAATPRLTAGAPDPGNGSIYARRWLKIMQLPKGRRPQTEAEWEAALRVEE
jgi:hypothetical protein